MLARDIAACACVNKTAARAARLVGWRELLMRTLPHAAGRDAVATLCAYQRAARSSSKEAKEVDVMLSRFVVTMHAPRRRHAALLEVFPAAC